MKHFCILLLFSWTLSAFGQASILAKRIDIRVTEKPLEEVLQILSKSGDFFFSYNAKILSLDRTITLEERNIPIKEVLDRVIGNPQIQYKEIGNHIILNKVQATTRAENKRVRIVETKKKKVKPQYFVISGFILDSLSGRKLANASVYEQSQGIAAISDKKGFYQLRLAPSSELVRLSISHRFYEAKSYKIAPEKEASFSPKLLPRTISRVAPTPSLLASAAEINPIQNVFLVKQLVKAEMLEEPLVQEEIEPRFAQLSFIPLASTNGAKSFRKTNRFSLNVLAGYSAGVKGVEIGGLMNIDRNEVDGLQIAGLGNVVGGNTNGLQIGGIFNVNRRSVRGAQFAGINNWADSLVGVQFSPINNVLVGRLKGVQGTAIVNVSKGEIQGLQLAGIGNWGKALEGAQIAGIANISTGNFSGAQVAGIVNYAKKGKGVQIGLINISDSLDGVAIGFLNLTKKGYNSLEVSSSLTLTSAAKLKMGNHRLYNIFAIGARPGAAKIWGYGYGLGNALKVTSNSYLHTEFIVWQIHQDQSFITDLNLLSQLHISYHLPISPRFEISLGPVLNFHISNYLDSGTGKPLSDLNPYAKSFELTNQGNLSEFWVGAQIGFTLLKDKRVENGRR